MTRREFIFWSLSSIAFFCAGVSLLLFPEEDSGWYFIYLLAIVLMLLTKDKNAPAKPKPLHFYQKRWFWTTVLVTLLLIWAIYSFRQSQAGSGIIIFLSFEMIILNYFETKYNWSIK